MINLLIVFFALVFAWLIVSQMIAWAMTPDKDPEKVREGWAALFLMPVILAFILLAFAQQSVEIKMRKAGMPVTPKENPMEYL
jgi:ABC-type uncharacterized transport system permease subunit